jgi:aspartyl-tRNA(Asn)/glutamyl-tRNA(Gln) amidotransferase subunit B
MSYLAVIGMEIHAELATRSKMFCGCVNDPFATEPNTNICPICLGHPGTLPTLNAEAIRMLVSLAADLGATVDPLTKWDRKHYFYPDLPKGYQISQFDQPLLRGGHIELSATEDWPLTRIHLEEDTGTLIHPTSPSASQGQVPSISLVDFNRSGVPLAELVTEPIVVPIDQAPGLAKRFCETYQFMLQRRGISRANMEKGELRCEANVSVIEARSEKREVRGIQVATPEQLTGTKVEVKNLNSFRAVERAVAFELERQIAALEAGESLVMETRGWDETKQRTVSQRAKETSAEYRYFPDPDLPTINPRVMFRLDDHPSAAEPFPYQLATQLVAEYGLAEREAAYFTTNAQAYADLTELIDEADDDRDLLRVAASLAVNFEVARTVPIPERLVISRRLVARQLPRHQLRPLFDAMNQRPTDSAESLIAELGLADQSNDDELARIIATVLEHEADAVVKYRAGKVEILGYLIGAAMRVAHGKLDPALVRTTLMKKLKALSR